MFMTISRPAAADPDLAISRLHQPMPGANVVARNSVAIGRAATHMRTTRGVTSRDLHVYEHRGCRGERC